MDQSTPKKFARLFREKPQKNKISKNLASKDKISKLQIKPQESLKAFKKRVQVESTQSIAQACQEAKPTREARKAYQKKLLQRKKQKKSNTIELEQAVKNRNRVKFGEQVHEPPKITAIPQAAKHFKNGSEASELEAQRTRALELYHQLKLSRALKKEPISNKERKNSHLSLKDL